MLDHVSIGVRDTNAAKRFYDPVMASLGCTALSEGDGYLGYGREAPQFWVLKVERPVAPDMASGLHFSFTAPTRAAVDEFHAAALKRGGTCNGAPGLRPDYGPSYYAAFVIDPDGYRIEAHTEAA